MTTFIPSITLPSQVFAYPAVSILLPLGGGILIGGLVTPTHKAEETYLALKQPPGRPPAWVFGPVWTVLYSLMGYAAHRAWHVGSASLDPRVRDLTRHGATLYTIQLALNFLWTPLYFGLRRPVEASVDIVALTGAVGYLTYVWGQVDEVVGWCLAPYCAWVAYASYICIGSGVLNKWDFSFLEKKQAPGGEKKTD